MHSIRANSLINSFVTVVTLDDNDDDDETKNTNEISW